MQSGQILFRDDQKVIEKVEVDADEGHSRRIGDLCVQPSHGTLAHQKAPAWNQRDWLEEESVWQNVKSASYGY